MGNWKKIPEIKAEILAQQDIIQRAEKRILYLRSLLSRRQYTMGKLEEYVQRLLYVSDIVDIQYGDIISAKSTKEVAQLRHVLFYHLYYDRKIPIMKIGKLFGRHHTTVLSGRDKIKMELTVFDDVKKLYSSITAASDILDKQGIKLED